MTLDVVDHTPAPLDVNYWGGVLTFAAQVADAVSDTEFVPGALRGRREAVAATILYGAEVGLTPMQALAGIHVVDGKPQPSAELARGLILRAGHTFHVVEMSGTRARVWGQRRGRPDSERVVVEWTLDMARAAGLLGRPPWQRYPRAMLVARATGDLARILFPDVVKGLGYVAEDESAADIETWATPTVPEVGEPARKPIQRRKRTPTTTRVESADTPAPGPLAGDSDEVAPTPDLETPEKLGPDDEAYLAEARRRAEEARAEVEAELIDEALPSAPPPYPKGHIPGDVPLPEDLRPVGTGRPTPVGEPVPTSPANEATPLRVTRVCAGKPGHGAHVWTEERDGQETPYQCPGIAPTLPDPLPENPDDEQTPRGFKGLGERPARAMQAGITRELGTVATREERHALVEAIVRHPIESTKTLPRAEGYQVLDYLDRFADGDAWWEFVGKRIIVHDEPRASDV